jgi:SNF2 family DNA or RNA helicase
MQTIALIVMNQPEPKNERKSTLIVAPAALLDQVSSAGGCHLSDKLIW